MVTFSLCKWHQELTGKILSKWGFKLKFSDPAQGSYPYLLHYLEDHSGRRWEFSHLLSYLRQFFSRYVCRWYVYMYVCVYRRQTCIFSKKLSGYSIRILYLFLRAAVTHYHHENGLNSRNLLSQSSGVSKSKSLLRAASEKRYPVSVS